MIRTFTLLASVTLLFCCTLARADFFGSEANAFEIEFVTVGRPWQPDRSGRADCHECSPAQWHGKLHLPYGQV